MAIWANGYTNNSGSSGRVYMYRRDPASGWLLDQLIDPSVLHTSRFDRFAQDIILIRDTLYISRRSQDTSVEKAGSLLAYKRTGPPNAPWVYLGEIFPNSPIEDGQFGIVLAGTEEALFAVALRVPRAPRETLMERHLGGVHVLREDLTAPTGVSDTGEVLTYDFPRTTSRLLLDVEASGRIVASASTQDSNLAVAGGLIYLFNTNNAPVAVSERLEVRKNTALEFVPSVTDQENDPIQLVITSQPQNGFVESMGRRFIYTPREDFVGTDSFSYRAWDDDDASQQAVVTIDVVEVPDVPTVEDQSLSTIEDTPVTATLLATAPEGTQTLRFEVVTPPDHGVVAFDGETVTYTPAPDFYGDDAFVYRALASLPSSPATVTIEVAEGPDSPRFPGLPTTVEVMWGERFSFDVEVVEVDGESTTTSAKTSLPEGATFLGGTFTWRPSFEQVGMYTFVLEAVDETEDSSTGELTVVVLAGDADGNGIPDDEDVQRGFDPFSPDDDGDGIPDDEEVGDWEMPLDTDGDGIPDVLDTDSDDDGITDDVDSCPRDVNSSSDVDDDGIDDVCDDDIRFVEDFAWVESEEPEDRLQSRGCVVGGTHHKEPKPSHLFVLALFFVAIRLRRKPTRRID